nr:hypothetical protein [Tanacetum cinerariifolium]
KIAQANMGGVAGLGPSARASPKMLVMFSTTPVFKMYDEVSQFLYSSDWRSSTTVSTLRMARETRDVSSWMTGTSGS